MDNIHPHLSTLHKLDTLQQINKNLKGMLVLNPDKSFPHPKIQSHIRSFTSPQKQDEGSPANDSIPETQSEKTQEMNCKGKMDSWKQILSEEIFNNYTNTNLDQPITMNDDEKLGYLYSASDHSHRSSIATPDFTQEKKKIKQRVFKVQKSLSTYKIYQTWINQKMSDITTNVHSGVTHINQQYESSQIQIKDFYRDILQDVGTLAEKSLLNLSNMRKQKISKLYLAGQRQFKRVQSLSSRLNSKIKTIQLKSPQAIPTDDNIIPLPPNSLPKILKKPKRKSSVSSDIGKNSFRFNSLKRTRRSNSLESIDFHYNRTKKLGSSNSTNTKQYVLESTSIDKTDSIVLTLFKNSKEDIKENEDEEEDDQQIPPFPDFAYSISNDSKLILMNTLEHRFEEIEINPSCAIPDKSSFILIKNEDLYFIGGMIQFPYKFCLGFCLKYNLKKKSSSNKRNINYPRFSISLINFNNFYIFGIGGFSMEGFTTKCEKYNSFTDNWSAIPNLHLIPLVSSFCSCLASGNYIYAFGIRNENYFCTHSLVSLGIQRLKLKNSVQWEVIDFNQLFQSNLDKCFCLSSSFQIDQERIILFGMNDSVDSNEKYLSFCINIKSKQITSMPVSFEENAFKPNSIRELRSEKKNLYFVSHLCDLCKFNCCINKWSIYPLK